MITWRIRGVLALATASAFGTPVMAATPASGTLSTANPQFSFTSGPHFVSNPSASAQPGGICNPPSQPCDHFDLTVELPADYKTTNPQDSILISGAWPNHDEDFDFYLFKSNGTIADDAATSANPEVMEIPAGQGTQTFRIRVLPFAVVGGTATVTITLVTPPPPPPDADGDGITDANDLCPGTPPETPVDDTGCTITEPPGPQCFLPGPALLSDPDNDATNASQSYDIRSLSIAEQNFTTGKKLYFTLKVDSLAPFPSGSNRWIVTFTGADGKFYYLQMIKFTDVSEPLFEYGTTPTASTTATTGPGCFAALGNLEPESTYAADGTITLVVRAATVGGVAGGQSLTGIAARAQALNGTSLVCGASTNFDTASTADAFTSSKSCPLIVEPPPPPPSGLPPRFYDFQSPAGLADSAGEPTIGYNPATKNAMFIAGTEVDRVTFAENSVLRDAAGAELPEACAPVWQNKSYDGAATTLDPILETEPISGRTFQSSLSGANSIFAFSDDDGDLWIPGQAGPPNGGVDHQTVGVGRWAPAAKPPSATEDYAVYYCSQSIAAAFCSRSDNGGVSFGPGIAFRDSATDCDGALGGLHGHVQVARNDGTVYVPFGNCGSKVGVARSFNSGVTWDVKKVGPSVPGDDPGLGIANDGTLYLCYAGGNGGRMYATTSKDRGDSWSPPQELGAALGIRHTVFATAVAGDGDRAACAFLGTTTAGSPEALDFEGVWHPYVATTYDGGKSWHTVNVSPGDPVQGWGGICLGGISCGSNRNLLDFNDIIMDDEGRLLFGYADGCRGACVQDPSKNTFSDNGVIARQSGGRTLLSAFDDKPATQFNTTDPIQPAAACASTELSRRTNVETRVAWTPPDHGGLPVLNYEVYRAESAAGPFTLVGEAGLKTSFLDATADPGVPSYFYRVIAENAVGAAPVSNIIELPLTVIVDESSCVVPGVTVARESTAGACAGTGGGCTPQTDIQSIHAAELESQPDTLTLTMKVQSLSPAPAVGTYWFLLTKKEDGTNLYFAMDTGDGPARFSYGTYAVGTLTTFTEQGTITGSFNTNGSIFLQAPKSLFGDLQPGDIIASLEARTRAGDSAAPSRDVVGPGDYTVRGTKVCLPNTPPVAVLSAVPQSGSAPLAVTFDGSGSYDADENIPDTIKTYVIDFGDGLGSSAEGGAPPIWQHTYANPGVYSAKLRVTDSRNQPSDNAAEKVIQVVTLGASADPANPDNNRLGGAMPALALLLLALGAHLRRRRAGTC